MNSLYLHPPGLEEMGHSLFPQLVLIFVKTFVLRMILLSRGQFPLDRPLLPFSPTWFSPKSQFMYRGIAPPTPWLAAPPGGSTPRCRSGSYLSQALIYPGAAASAGGILPWTGPGSPCRISCCCLDDMVNTEAEEVEVAAPLAGEQGGAARSGDTVPP